MSDAAIALSPRRHAAALLLSAIVVLAPIPFGSARGPAMSALEIGIFSMFALALVSGALDAGLGRVRPFLLPAACLIGFIFLQTLPLPPALIRALSPETARLYDEMLGDTGQWCTLSIDPYATQLALVRLVAYAGAFVLAATAETPGQRTLLLWAVLCSGGVAAAIAWTHFFNGWENALFGTFTPLYPFTLPQRFHWPLVNPNHFAALMNLTWPIALGALVWPRMLGASFEAREAIVHRAFAAVVLLASFGALVATRSRGGLVSAAVALLVLLAAWPAGEGRERLLAIAARIVALVALAVGVAWFANEFSTPLAMDLNLIASERQDATFRIRLEVARQTWDVMRSFWPFGTGAGTWAEIFPRYERYPLFFASFAYAHNDYVEWASDLGVAGLAIVLVLAARYFAGVAQSEISPSARRRRAILGAPLSAIAVHALGDFALRIPANALVTSILLGLLWRECGAPERAAASDPSLLALAGAVLSLALLYPATFEWRDWWLLRPEARDRPLDPERVANWRVLASAAWSQSHLDQPNRDLALRAVAAGPAAADAHRALAYSYRSIRMRELELRRMVASAPAHAERRIELARLLYATGRMAEAARHIEQAAYDAPDLTPRDLLQLEDPTTGRREFLAAALAGLRRRAIESPETIAHVERVEKSFREGAP